jgi:hypothetical protein
MKLSEKCTKLMFSSLSLTSIHKKVRSSRSHEVMLVLAKVGAREAPHTGSKHGIGWGIQALPQKMKF